MPSRMALNPDIKQANLQICMRCIYDERMPSISFDQNGICNYCYQIDYLKEQYGTGTEKGHKLFESILKEIKKVGRGKVYDCIVGVSGGTDSSYLLYMAKEVWGLRPLAVHYDNTWNSAIATMNIQKVLAGLDIDLYTHVVDNKEADDIFRSFFLSGVAEIDSSTDLGYAYLLRQVAAKYSVKFILEGHSFTTEGITPLGCNYFDGRYIQSIHNHFGRLPLKTYPLMTFSRFLKSAVIDRVKFIRPLWYLDYSKEEAQNFLRLSFSWEYYGGHHLENRMTAFTHGIYLPKKFLVDLRNNALGARVRNGSLSRADAWAEYSSVPKVEGDLDVYFRKRLNISEELYNQVMQSPPKSWMDYPTYKKRFENLRPLFHVLVKANLVPMSFYLKYCFPIRN